MTEHSVLHHLTGRADTEYDRALRIMDDREPDLSSVRLLLERAVEKGDDRAAYALGTWFLHGKHVDENFNEGVRLLELASMKGNVEAAFDLAVCFEKGLGVEKSEARAFSLYQSAAEKGDVEAMREVGRMLYYGLGVAEDQTAADHWLAKAERGVQEPDTAAALWI